MIPIRALWKFSRPHTIIGSVISIFTLYLIIYDKQEHINYPYLFVALGIGITCNIFIVGINQIADVNIDRINKPYLPIPSGELSISEAKTIVYLLLIASLGMALFVNTFLFGIIALAGGIGWAYSMPPLYLKQHHITAAIAIATVRGILLNACGFMVFNYRANHIVEMPMDVKILTLFIFLFSIVIAWFKDLPDMEGDARYKIKTLALLYSPKTAFILGNLLVGLAYCFTIYFNFILFSISATPSSRTKILLAGHLLLFVLFVVNSFSIKLKEHASVKKYYKRFWWFFFAEYVVYLFAYMVKG